MKYRDWYNSKVVNKLSEIKYDMECSYFAIDCDDPMDLNADVIAMPTPREFIDWINEKGQYFVSIIPEDDYNFGHVFAYKIYKLDYDNHFNLIQQKSNFINIEETYTQVACDLLIKLI